MRKPLLLGVGALAATCLIWNGSIRESESAPLPENTLLGIRLGRSYLDVLRLYGGPNQILTVAVPGASGGTMMPGGDMGMPGDVFGGGGSTGGGAPAAGSGPGLPPPPGFGGSGGAFPPGMSGGGGAFPGMPRGSGGAFPGMPGGAGMAGPLGRRGAMMGSGGGGSPFGPPVLPSAGAEGMGPGMPGMPGMMPGMPGGMMGSPGGLASPGAEGSPEVSSALLWIYNKGNNVRLEFLINEDGRVAQISVAAPAKSLTRTVSSLRGQVPIKTGRGITLGSNYARVVQAYGFPEKTRLIMGGRFDESYFTKNYHAAFTVDGLSQRKVVRITITLAD